MDGGLIALIVLIFVHLFANRQKVLGWVWKGPFLSFASGITLAYVFIDLLPALEKGLPALKRTFDPILPKLERHTYLIALIGILFYYGMHSYGQIKKNLWIAVSGYVLFNFLIGISLSDRNDPEIQPLFLFTIAIALHYFIRDHIIHVIKRVNVLFVLVFALASGFIVGKFIKIPDAVSAIGISFAAGGIILNTFQYELPKKEKSGYFYFVLGALLYASLILNLG